MGLFGKVFSSKKDKAPKGIGALLPMPTAGRVNPNYIDTLQGNNRYCVDWTANLPQNIMQRIFEFVCPHTMDESYESSESSAGNSCMLCDMRDLSYCVLVCKRWRKYAVPVL